VDRLTGGGTHGFESNLHFPPGCELTGTAGGAWRWTLPAADGGALRGTVTARGPAGQPLALERRLGRYAPRLGQELLAPYLSCRGRGALPLELGWVIQLDGAGLNA
jgi:hypothetical protein